MKLLDLPTLDLVGDLDGTNDDPCESHDRPTEL